MIETIHQFEIFRDLSAAEISLIEKSCVIKLFDKDDIVMKSDENAKTLFIVLEGRIITTQTIIRNSGRKPVEFRTGNFFGELSLAGSKPGRPSRCRPAACSQAVWQYGWPARRTLRPRSRLGIDCRV